ncbi:unnamed protein product [Penicillium nalgiovense]|nr:unnamed protein product [Penicillium nalgiovense]
MDASNVTFDPPNMYSNNPQEKTRIINLVISQAPAGAASAILERLAHQQKRQTAALYRRLLRRRWWLDQPRAHYLTWLGQERVPGTCSFTFSGDGSLLNSRCLDRPSRTRQSSKTRIQIHVHREQKPIFPFFWLTAILIIQKSSMGRE